jgi:hypothetical protein
MIDPEQARWIAYDAAHLVRLTAQIQVYLHEMIQQANWRGDDVDQLSEDLAAHGVHCAGLLDATGDFNHRGRLHLAAHKRHMVLATRFEKMLDQRIHTGKAKR